MTDPIAYRVRPAEPHAHLFEVELTIAEPAPEGQVLSLPAWIPGSYMIRDFAKHVTEIRASGAGRPLALRKRDKQTWQCAPSDGPLQVRYRVYCWDLSVRGAHLDGSHGYFNGTSLFLAVHGREHEPHVVYLEPPGAGVGERWRVATSLPRAGAQRYGFGRYQAADYDELLDHPVEMGTFTLVEFEAGGVPHAMALSGRQRCDTARLARDLKQVCEYHIGLFGGPPPMEEYLFLTMVVGDGYGGLEHRASCSLMCSRADLPVLGVPEIGEGYRGFLGLCSHEYFHTWNVKRIRPAAFMPYDLSREVHTPLLWAFEGITSYYDDLALVRSGLIEPDSYLELLARTITRVLRGPGRLRQSVAESSFDAWTKFYKQDENAPNAVVSYYAKGALIALALDLAIRRASAGERSLDDLMRALWRRYLDTGAGVTPEGIEALAADIAGEALDDFFDQALRGTADLDLENPLRTLGIGLRLRPAEGDADKGGRPPATPRERPWLGARLVTEGDEARLAVVLEDGPAQRAGLSAGDVVLALDGLRVRRGDFEQRLGAFAIGETIAVHAFRRDELLLASVALTVPPADTVFFTIDELEGPAAERRRAWLGR